MNALAALVEALAASFPDDPSQPSVVFSRLKNGCWYGSLVRYTERFGGGKQVLYKTQADTVEALLRKLLAAVGVEFESVPADTVCCCDAPAGEGVCTNCYRLIGVNDVNQRD